MSGSELDGKWTARRLVDRPIISAGSDPSIGENIQGPSLIRAPEWIKQPLGRYYLYFADHKGRYIRLAYADALAGPWTVHRPGSLRLEQSHFPIGPLPLDDDEFEAHKRRYEKAGRQLPHDLRLELTTPHIASPDVHVDDDNQRIVMYFHGLEAPGRQVTRVATSTDGIHFAAKPEIVVERSYLRVFEHRGTLYGMAMPGQLYRSTDGFARFTEGPLIFNPNLRHFAMLKRGDTLHVFWTQVGDAPERILVSTIDLSQRFEAWEDRAAQAVLRPERPWEGAAEPMRPSMRSVAYGLVNQLRDPAIYQEDRRVYLLYAAGGESGIGIAELEWEAPPRGN
ncbi:hypothetical protein BH23CHL2_BH23CHL2_10060 [soil metagenome]